MTATAAAAVPIGERCVLCGCRLTTPYFLALGLCGSCKERPEAKQLPRDAAGRALERPRPVVVVRDRSRAFTPAERSLIQHTHTYLPAAELLRILNERVRADLGAAAPLHTLEQLQAALQSAVTPAAAGDWGSLRQLLTQARASGVLATITPATIDDFAAVFKLSAAQLMTLKDTIAHAQEDR